MPFTPFHLGPGALFKAVGGNRFSFMVFGGAQFLMDIEPLVRMQAGDDILHGPTHTVFGALVIGAIAAGTGKPISSTVLRSLRTDSRTLTWRVSFVSAFIGTFSHVLFDAVMHRDMAPFWPFASGNPFLDVVSILWLHAFCFASGLLGLTVILLRGERTPDKN